MAILTNILALPLAAVTIETANNEDWIDAFMYVAGPDGTYPQLDLTGIRFEMEVRRTPPDHEVILHATTADGTGALTIGAFPDVGYLIIGFKQSAMELQEAGTYVGDIVASAEGYTRRTITFNLTIIEGIVR